MAIKLIAFDWNGTLLSDAQTAVNAENIALKQLGLKSITLNKFRQCFDIPIIQYWKNVGMDENFFKSHMHEIEKIYLDIYEPMAKKTRTRAGVKNILDWLNKEHINRIIYSNHVTAFIDHQLYRLKIKKYFHTIIARNTKDDTLLHNRGKGEKLKAYIKLRQFKPTEVISVGDTEEEIEIGKKFGYHTVAITGGYNSTKRLKKHHPDFLIHNMLELKSIIKQLNN